jgi:hypothetical protein
MSEWKAEQDQPAMTLAAIRWYAMSIEKYAMDLYITNREQYPAVKAILDNALESLEQVRSQQSVMAEDAGCPPGFKNCGGICLPDCVPGSQY